MSNLIPIDQARALAPAKMRDKFAAGNATNKAFSEGVRDAFPTLSIKGKVFRMRQGGREVPYVDPQTNQVMTYLDIVLVNASRFIAKSYYVKGFTEGDNDAPSCWSLDGIRPDASVATKQSVTCAACPMNAFGSRVTDNGKQAKACQDQRRVAITLPHLLETAVPTTVMLRAPQSSLKNMKDYAELLARHQFEPTGCVTRISFDYNEAFPKLQFQFVRGLSEQEYDKVEALGMSDYVQQMLNTPEDTAPTPAAVTPQDVNPLAGLVPQTPPVLEEDNEAPDDFTPLPADVAVAPVVQPTVAAQVQTAVAATVAANLVRLPDGKMFNPLTGQYVVEEAPKPVQVKDPDVLALPDGRFFNQKTGQFVVTDQMTVAAPMAAPVAEAPAAAPEKAKRTRKPKEAPEAELPLQQAQTAPAAALPDNVTSLIPPAAQAAPVQAVASPKPKAPAATNGGGAVGVAPPDLDAILKGLVPPTSA